MNVYVYNTIKWGFLTLLGAWFALITVTYVAASPINLSSSETYNFTYNGSGSQDFLCLDTNTTDFDPVNLTFTLVPGENRTVSEGVCTLNSYCETESTVTGLCSIERTLGPGDRLSRQNGACDLNIKCDADFEVGSCLLDNETVTYPERVRFFKDGDVVRFRFGDRERVIDENVSALPYFSYEFEEEYKCPADVGPEFLQDRTLQEFCQATYPDLVSLFGRSLDNSQDCDLRRQEAQDEFLGEVDDLRNEAGSLRGELESTKSELVICQDDSGEMQSELSDLKSSNNVKSFLVGIFALWAFGATAGLILSLRGKGDKGVEL